MFRSWRERRRMSQLELALVWNARRERHSAASIRH
jgi:hypothetical protein